MEKFLKAVGVVTIAIVGLCVFSILLNVMKMQASHAAKIAVEREYTFEEAMSGKAGQQKEVSGFNPDTYLKDKVVPQDQLPEELRTK